MSPTPTRQPSDASIQEFHRIRDELVGSNLSTDVEGCDEEEIAQVAGAAPFALPDDYLAFLKVLGRRCSPIFDSDNVRCPACLEATEVAEDLARNDDETLTVEDRFFFGQHDGYIVYFFERGNPAVYGYKEGEPNIYRLGETFSAWTWQMLDNAKERRAEHVRIRAEIEEKRAVLRAEGKIDW